MTDLRTSDFVEFVRAVHGHEPFPWQLALVESVQANGWPDVIDVPTGLGKTSVIDAFVFLRAIEAGQPRRLFHVVDRRVVVDEAFDHARRVATALNEARDGIVAEVARRLGAPDPARPLDVVRMRGGATWAWRWIERPDSIAVVTGTVAQLGSRLLFRGYGVSEYRRSIDAAMVGTDSLLVIDEAHLAEPFLTTARDAFALDGAHWPRPTVVTMSATTADDGRRVHRVSPGDEANPVAGRRLHAAKRLTTRFVDTRPSRATKDVAPALVAAAEDAIAAGHLTVGVVVNTVARARAVFDLVRQRHEAVLLTGRIREHDREALLSDWLPRFRRDRDRSAADPVVLVATQTVEVGVNIDLDALVTESCSIDALVQRLGRLNRFGDATSPAPAVVVHDGSVDDGDAVYGPARLETWRWLNEVVPDDGSDASPLALRRLLVEVGEERRRRMTRPEVDVPVLTAERLACFARTSPAPVPDLPVEPFLYGFRDAAPEVLVVWRAGLTGDGDERDLAEAGLVPPAPAESLELPLGAVQRWLGSAATDGEVSDGWNGDGAAVDAEGWCIVRRGDAEPERRRIRDLRPGDTVIVPVQRGGGDEFGWAPAADRPVLDVGDLVDRRGRRIVRVGPSLRALLPDELRPAFDELVAALRPEGDPIEPAEAVEVIREWAGSVVGAPDELRPVLSVLADPASRITVTDPSTASVAVVTGARGRGSSAAEAGDETAVGSSAIGVAVGLAQHHRQVAALAARWAANLGLPSKVVASVEAAAGWHDEGKRDPRFQAMLHGGDRLAAEAADEPLAKSGMDPAARWLFRLAQQRSGYPRGMRHEALSARIAEDRFAGDDHVDADLVVHLVASHHGRSRPLLPPVCDGDPVVIEREGRRYDSRDVIDWSSPARFDRLHRRYGYWGLALLESIVRLADIWASERPDVDGHVEDGSD